MPFNIETTLKSVESKFAASGYFERTMVGEPKSAPQGSGLTASIFMQEVGVSLIYADGGTRELHTVLLRIHRNMLAEPVEEIELELARTVSQITSDLVGDADLGSTVMSIDVGGMDGTPVSTRWGYVDVSGTMFRIADMTLPIIVNDSAKVSA